MSNINESELNRLMEKWGAIFDVPGYTPLTEQKKQNLAVLLENTVREEALSGKSQSSLLIEDAPANNTAAVSNYNPVMISMIRRAIPNLIAYDVAGVQAMTGPTGLIFAAHPQYVNKDKTTSEAFYDEADTGFGGTGVHKGNVGDADMTTGSAMSTAAGEALGDTGENSFPEMKLKIDKVNVFAQTRAMKAELTNELAQDMKSIHGLDAETELANLLAAELLTEMNRELIRKIWETAVVGSPNTAVPGTYDMDTDADGRWGTEKFKNLIFAIEKEANAVAKATRRGKGNIILCSSDVGSALQLAGMLEFAPALNSNNSLAPDDTGNTFIGVLNGRFRVYIDPYATNNYLVVGYKGPRAFDAGLFYCPYVPLQMVRAVGENNFQQKIGFKTRYGLVANPFSTGKVLSPDGKLVANSNVYYRKSIIKNLH